MSTITQKINFLRIVEIEKIVRESPTVKTFFFADELSAQGKPGQFIMVWIPGYDEVPMSISSTCSDDLVSITVANVGEATRIMHKQEAGGILGIRGPFGNSFSPVKGKALLVGGGTGIAPLVFLAAELAKLKTKLTFLLGAKTKEELIFLSYIKAIISRTKGKINAATEDGSFGHKGVVTELVETTLAKEKFDKIYACGREPMLYKIFELSNMHKISLQMSLERIIRCAIGLCGSCTIGKYRVCADGPVFTSNQLQEVVNEFGKLKRDFNGTKISV
ncbi:MAG: dihydroorotate dehydrogenase electron transfer subunit [Candidatus Bathyarchaeota archaeon]|nr:MAG: dihydroorotate dehydrogenase electron transfer subunit [Candidatus Bathyarchaeota archaeon]